MRDENQPMRSTHPPAVYVGGTSGCAMKICFDQRVWILKILAVASWLHAAPPPASLPDDHVPCKISQRVHIAFPARPLSEGIIYGEVTLMMDVDRTGRLADVLVVTHTGRDFADSALDAVKQWRFTPARIAGEPVGSTITLTVEFQVNGVLAYVKPPGAPRTEDAFGDRVVHRPFSIASLDRVPVALSRPGPIYPREWIGEGRTGTVNVEFFIDESGQVRFPRVVSGPDEFLGAAAVAAVKEWRFEPALHQGRPVLVRAQQAFYFRVETPAAKSPR